MGLHGLSGSLLLTLRRMYLSDPNYTWEPGTLAAKRSAGSEKSRMAARGALSGLRCCAVILPGGSYALPDPVI
ncbi:hypothetical protein LNP26_23075 [Klebsiella variicola subsp. variicola]|nr:hypothetical protein [Klebsiella variicola subsp. variicola]